MIVAPPPSAYETGVYDDQIVHFRPRGDNSKSWLVDVDQLSLQATLDNLYNVVYTRYRDDRSITRRTPKNLDDFSKGRYGLERARKVDVDTTSETQAQNRSDSELEDTKIISPRTAFTIRGDLITTDGGTAPKFLLRSGDTITIRNFPPTLDAVLGKASTFRVLRMDYNLDTDSLTVTPESVPTLIEFELARALTR